MTDAEKRRYVSNLYRGPRWKKTVAKMPIDQVVAIFLKHQGTGIRPPHDEEPHLHVPPQDPHLNEDQFEIY